MLHNHYEMKTLLILIFVFGIGVCDDNLNNCFPNAKCENTGGSVTCVCDPCYVMIGTSCIACEDASTGYTYDCDSDLCYKVHTNRSTWVDAQANCVSEGGMLAKVDTPAKRELVNDLISKDRSVDYYIGGQDTDEDGVWRWVVDNSRVLQFNGTGPKQCLEISYKDFGFDDSGCNNAKQNYICELL